ncbi:endonuclease/exonuclease/phosphatase family protein [Bacteroidales bacterium OttesenSCG-928-J19]|nr:endonuclease/exonuclease/phosphatase family protein [Bacteroidales bacterium OttesenSCG-928-J19]
MKKFWKILLSLLCAFSGLLLLTAAYSDWVSPFRAVIFSYLGLFFPFILVFAGLVLLFTLIIRQWRFAIAMGIVFLICMPAILTYFPMNKQTKNVPEDCIKVLTYNTMRFEYLKQHRGDQTNPILDYILEEDPDIICLQEFGASLKKGNDLNINDIKKALHRTPYFHIEKLKFPYEGQSYGIALFSKYPIKKAYKISYESTYNGSFVAELDVNGKQVMLINNHLESNKLSMDERTGYEGLTKDPSMQEFKSFTQSMFKRLTPAFRQRAFQAQLIAKEIKESKAPYVIVCGDFNDTPISYARHKIKGDLLDAFTESGRGMGITYNRYRFFFRIDYILHSKNIKSYNTKVGSLRNSDHYPVSTYLHLEPTN